VVSFYGECLGVLGLPIGRSGQYRSVKEWHLPPLPRLDDRGRDDRRDQEAQRRQPGSKRRSGYRRSGRKDKRDGSKQWQHARKNQLSAAGAERAAIVPNACESPGDVDQDEHQSRHSGQERQCSSGTSIREVKSKESDWEDGGNDKR
jgi:hypothetical protein